ncbi:polycystic kidney disease 1 like 1 [Caerostris extrusa]|uniref:Polycystic kidney disease 1 like 1 n=1 Tax=Caerostris extrusa TaxID=172846 RepID=A0AAV4V8E7_CAEEX|nr:polycystic kidney disease 1 like 1 [Caerostris extrusa]
MLVQAAITLIALNYSLSDFFIGQNGTLSVTVNQPSLPDTIFVDFGDGSTYNSTANNSVLHHNRHGNSSSTFTISHVYQSAGIHVIYFNASNTISHFEHWTTVNAVIPISGVKLKLLSPSVVALLKKLLFNVLTENTSVAIHSYGVADTYNITVHVYNDYETVAAHLSVPIQAVEPIEKLHLRPRFDHYAAPLHERKSDKANESSPYITDAIVFEAWVWRGSDIQFIFDFGAGQTKLVPSELNVWSLPCATVKHFYTAEGSYEVSVTAINPLDSVNQSLSQPFYVQFAPEGLMLDKQYYIVQFMHNLSIHASITRGTNVSFNWILDNEPLDDTGSTLSLDFLRPGIHIVSVEVFNKVTDFAYKTIQRPSVSSKIYVQENLQEITLCLLHNEKEWCNENEIELSSDEKIIFIAKVLPSTEKDLFGSLGKLEFIVNVTAQNHISSISSPHLVLHLIQKVANLTSIHCQGPNLYKYTDDILVETEISTNCETNIVKYIWRINKENGSLVSFKSKDILFQRHLLVPGYHLEPGKYIVHLRVEISGFIVYAESSTTIEIQFPITVAYIGGGYLRLMGNNDTIRIETDVFDLGNRSHSMSYKWSCLPLTQRHLPCFQGAYLSTLSSTSTNSFTLSASSLTPGLTAVVINSTLENRQEITASQVIEINPVPHVLITMIDSDIGHDHLVNQDSKFISRQAV